MSYTTLVSAERLAEHLNDPTWVVVDCRFSLSDPNAGRKLYEAAHIPGAQFADVNRDLSSPIAGSTGRHPLPNAEHFMRQLGQWGIARSKQVVAYDNSGGAFAARLWWLLRWVGHETVAVLDGGYDAWVQAGFRTSADVPMCELSEFHGEPNADLWLSTDDLEQALDAGRIVLVDARDPERFRGEVEPIDPVAGHIPGAMNLPFKANLDSAGRFQPADLLKQRFTIAIVDHGPHDVVHMCGSGVTACHNVLAMEIAGLPGSKLYAGSWSEWLRQPGRKVAIGEK
jgi:thiosulfate/3-mercaptopyruvate sulfurtransferase